MRKMRSSFDRKTRRKLRVFFMGRRSVTGRFLRLVLPGLLLFAAGCATRTPQGLFEKNLRDHPESGVSIRGLKPQRRPDAAGEIACLTMVARYWGKSIKVPPAGAVGADGSPTDVKREWLMSAARQGLWSQPASWSTKALKQTLQKNIPLIVPLQDQPLAVTSRYYAVVAGYDDVDDSLLLWNRGSQVQILRQDDVLKKWSVQRFQALLLCPPDAPGDDLPAEWLMGRARFFQADGQVEQAVRNYELAKARGYPAADCYVGMGNVYLAAKQVAQAEAFYRQALAADETSAQACNNLAYLLAEEGRQLDEALALVERARLLEPANPLMLDTWGYVLYIKGRYREATDVLERARAKARKANRETRQAIARHLVWAYYRKGDLHLARQVLAEILREDPRADIPAEWRSFSPSP